MKTPLITIVLIILVAILGPQILFTVDETQLALVTRFGKIQAEHTSPGLKSKLPFVDSIQKFDKRLLRVDMEPSTFPDREKEFLVIDAYTRYRIVDVRKFRENLVNMLSAEDRIGRIVISALREEVAKRVKEEIIGGKTEEDSDGESIVIATNTRQEILDNVLVSADRAVTSPENDFGVQIVDVRIKRADFPDAALANIFERMRSERQRIAKEFRAEGEEENAKITARVLRDKTILLAEAEKTANLKRGEGEAQAIEIYAEALNLNPEFYAFQKSLDAYKTFLKDKSTIVLPLGSELFNYLDNPYGPISKEDLIETSKDKPTENITD